MMAVQFDNTGDLLSTELGNIGLTAAGFDYCRLSWSWSEIIRVDDLELDDLLNFRYLKV